MLSYQTVQTIIQLVRMILDILILWVLLFYTIKIVRNNSRTTQIFKGIVLVIVVQAIANYFGLVAVSWLAGTIVTYGFLAVIIIFQPELRTLLERIGKSSVFSRLSTLSGNERQYLVEALVHATMNLSQSRIGALITIEQNHSLNDYIKTGIKMNSLVTSDLIQTIFVPTTPLHDGAVIIQGDRIACASAYFPPSTAELPTRFGARHRAAIGISEITDSITIVVSEKSGRVSIAEEGQLSLVTQSALRAFLEKVILHDVVDVPHRQKTEAKVSPNNEPELIAVPIEVAEAPIKLVQKPARWYHKDENPPVDETKQTLKDNEVNKTNLIDKQEDAFSNQKNKTMWWPFKSKPKQVKPISIDKPIVSETKVNPVSVSKPIEKKEPIVEAPKPIEKKVSVPETTKPINKAEIKPSESPSVTKDNVSFEIEKNKADKPKWWQFSKPKQVKESSKDQTQTVETKDTSLINKSLEKKVSPLSTPLEADKAAEKKDSSFETPKRSTKRDMSAKTLSTEEPIKPSETKDTPIDTTNITTENQGLSETTEIPKRKYRKKETSTEEVSTPEVKAEPVGIKETPKVTLEYSVESESLFED
ncbi:MAG: diadenylate cyclase CdaA, partial [Erysipelotrichaceae bacterium]